jgi:lipopolysaccharide transport system permease protein
VTMTLLNGTLAFVSNGLLIRRVACPRISFVVGSLVANLPAPAVILVGALISLVITGRGLPTQAVLFPLVALWLILFTFALVCMFASLAVRFRDIQSLLPFWSQVGLFLTPVGYALSSAPGKTEAVLAFNPLTGIFELTRWCLLGTELKAFPVIFAAFATVLLVFASWRIFTRLEITFADVI